VWDNYGWRGDFIMAGTGAVRKYDAEVLADQLNDYIDDNDDPRLCGFCVDRDKPRRETLWLLAKDCSNLSNAVSRAKEKCEIYLTGSTCAIHPKIAGIRLAANHNMYEKVATELTGANGGAIQVEAMSPIDRQARIAELMAKSVKLLT
jgi:hypothetical protein